MSRKRREKSAIGRHRLKPSTLRAWRARLQPGDEVAVSGAGRGRIVSLLMDYRTAYAAVVDVPRPGYVSPYGVWYGSGLTLLRKCQPVRTTPPRGAQDVRRLPTAAEMTGSMPDAAPHRSAVRKEVAYLRSYSVALREQLDALRERLEQVTAQANTEHAAHVEERNRLQWTLEGVHSALVRTQRERDEARVELETKSR